MSDERTIAPNGWTIRPSGQVIRDAVEVLQRTDGVTGYDEVEELRAAVVDLLGLVQELIDGPAVGVGGTKEEQ